MLLVGDPNRRGTPEHCKRHPWLEEVHERAKKDQVKKIHFFFTYFFKNDKK
jgi:hypothetical protein